MLRLPSCFATVILSFAALFFQRSWRHAEVLLIGAIMAPGRRMVSSILRIVGLQRERRFVNHHRVPNRAVWSPHAASRLLLGLLIRAFYPRAGPALVHPALAAGVRLPGNPDPPRRRDTAPVVGPRPACWGCSPSSPCWQRGSGRMNAEPWPAALGIASQVPPSATPWPPFGVTSGASRVCSCHGTAATPQNPDQLCKPRSPTPSATPPEWPKSSLAAEVPTGHRNG